LFIFSPALAVDHSIHAIVAAQYMANVFMSFARQNPNKFATRRAEESHLIYRYSPIYVGNITDTPYEQIYLFPYLPEHIISRKIEQKDLL